MSSISTEALAREAMRGVDPRKTVEKITGKMTKNLSSIKGGIRILIVDNFFKPYAEGLVGNMTYRYDAIMAALIDFLNQNSDMVDDFVDTLVSVAADIVKKLWNAAPEGKTVAPIVLEATKKLGSIIEKFLPLLKIVAKYVGRWAGRTIVTVGKAVAAGGVSAGIGAVPVVAVDVASGIIGDAKDLALQDVPGLIDGLLNGNSFSMSGTPHELMSTWHVLGRVATNMDDNMAWSSPKAVDARAYAACLACKKKMDDKDAKSRMIEQVVSKWRDLQA